MRKWIISNVELQIADDGNTSYYGGEFTIQVDNESPNTYHFTGNDRQDSPGEQVYDAGEDCINLCLDDQNDEDRILDTLNHFIDHTDGKDKLVIYFDSVEFDDGEIKSSWTFDVV